MTAGQAFVEFALVLPVMILILLVAVDFGRLFFTYIQVNNAAREAAFAASQNLADQSSISARAAQEANVQAQGGEGILTVSLPVCATAANPPVSTTCPTGTPDAAFFSGAGHQVTVSVSRQFTFLTPIIGGFFPALSVGASATAPVVPVVASQGGGGGATSDTCAVVADFTFSQSKWNKEVDFDATEFDANLQFLLRQDPVLRLDMAGHCSAE